MIRKRIFKKTAAVFLVLAVMVASVAVCAPALYKKRGIIILPGLLASGLYDETTEEPLWDPFESEWSLLDFFDPDKSMKMILSLALSSRTISELLPAIIENRPESLFNRIGLNEDGLPTDERVKAVNFDTFSGNQRYGAFMSYRQMYEGMNGQFGAGVEVSVFNYDWRVDNRLNAEKLEEYIAKKGYTDVVLCGHSMGNIVIANYLARSEENRGKTLAHLSYAAPYYGSLMALSVLENLDGMLDGIVDAIDSIPLLKGLELSKTIIQLFDEQFRPLAYNMATLAQLLPMPELLDAEEYADSAFLYVDGQPLTGRDELLAFYRSREWSLKKDGTVKPYLADLDKYWDGMYVDTEKGRAHVSEFVDTYYFAGSGMNTEKAVHIENGKYAFSVHDSEGGDGTVLFDSAILNHSPTADNVTIAKSYDHFGCGCKFDETLSIPTYKILRKVLRKLF